MKKILLSLPLIAFTSAASAETIITYPQTQCTKFIGTDYSAPGGDSSTYIFELLCKDNENVHRVFVTTVPGDVNTLVKN